jgi:patatin-like phospholipase/acyl hydrolase
MAKFKILSLDGGGIRGAFTAAFLAEIEKSLEHPIREYFDLIAGTSTGAIIAAAVALGIPAEQIRGFYESKGQKLFTRMPPSDLGFWGNKGRNKANKFFRRRKIDLDIDYLLQSKYDSVELGKALKDVFESKTINDVNVARLLIPSVDLSAGKTIVFKTPHLPDASSRDRHYLITDVLLATSAAPTYFPHAVIRQGSAYCDGGLWANNPSIAAFAEAAKIRECCKRQDVDPCFELDDVSILSIGTGLSKYSIVPPEKKAGLGWWGSHLVDVMFQSQSQGISHQCDYILGDRHHRVDYDVPDSTWKLDSIGLLDRFFHFGRQEAHTKQTQILPKFFAAIATPYKQYPC